MKRQTGATLLVALIMLVLLTLTAVTSFNLGKNNLQVVANQQHRLDAEASAKTALEEVFSKATFIATPGSPLGTTNSKTYDVNGDGTADITVTVGAGSSTNPLPCIRRYSESTADPSNPRTSGCASGVQQQFGVEGSTTSTKDCKDTTWDITAQAEDLTTEASITVVQGVSVMTDTVDPTRYCTN